MRRNDRRFDPTRVNERIRIPEIRLIDQDGKQLGLFQTRDALVRARDLGFDLVEISPDARPPVCKIMDYGKYKYEQAKKESEAKKKQTVVHLKEIQLRPATGEHDIQTKMAHMKRFLEHGDKVKIVVRFRGREMAHMETGTVLMNRIVEQLKDLADVDAPSKREGKMLMLVLAPKKKK